MQDTQTSTTTLPTLSQTVEQQAKKMSKEEIALHMMSLDKFYIQNDPFVLIEDGHLWIKTKKDGIIPFVLNKAQIHIMGIVKRLWDEGKPIRLIVLKARQIGSTTEFMAIIYAIISQTESADAKIIADEKNKANEIFEMAKLFQERCPSYLRPEIEKSNERKLSFEGTHSYISIDTAENADAGRSATLRCVLLSEYAYYRVRNAEALMLGISHSMPSLAKTIRIKETTANGYNHFKDEWDMAVSGKTDEVPIFIPWYWDEGYKMKVIEPFLVGDPAHEEAVEEKELYQQMEEEGITNIKERLQWRRWDIRNSCKGDIDAFKQENPSDSEQAFLASGQCFFNQKQLVKQLKAVQKPLFRANIVKENFKYVIRKCADGDFEFFEEISKGGQYCVGGDAASGSGADYSCLVARNKGTNRVACVYHAKADPDELAHKAMLLGSLLNNCIVAIESDKFGFAANEKLRTIYGNVYVQRTFNKVENKVIEKIGWDTNSVTRPLMLGQMQEEIREGSLDLMDERIIRECLTFIKNAQSKKAEAEEGKNDDLVIATAISGQIRHDEPFKVKPERPRGQNRQEGATKNAGLKFQRKR